MRFEVTQIKSMIVNAYLLTGEHVALVDTLDGMGYGKIQKALRGKGLEVSDVEFILITHHHSDHAKNAAKIKRLSGATLIAVSYTHLRAHETRHDLVCRLLLEKKKKKKK